MAACAAGLKPDELLVDNLAKVLHSWLQQDHVLRLGLRRFAWSKVVIGAFALATTTLVFNVSVSRAEATEIVSGYGRTLHFAGYDWLAKTSSVLVGPGPNYFSDSLDNVWIDSQGSLHLRLTRDASGQWSSCEVVLQRSLGYGTYTFQLDATSNELDVNAVLGMFTWNDDPTDNHRELDIEIARWGQSSAPNGRYTVQPYQVPGRMFDFQQPPVGAQTTQRIDWHPDRVRFQSWMGWSSSPPSTDAMIAEHTFDSGVPRPGGEQTRINLWLDRGAAPVDMLGTEVIVRNFEFVPMLSDAAGPERAPIELIPM